MAERVLLTHSYFYKYDQKQWKMHQPFPPLMTITAAALLRENGFEVGLFDVGLKNSPEEIQQHLESFAPDFLVLVDDGFNYLTKMCLTTMRSAAFRMQEYGRRYGARVITASSDATDHYEKYLDHGADVVIRGEPEMTLLELLKHGDTFEEQPGIAYRAGKKTILNQPRPIMTVLDELPLPAWDLVDINSYRKEWSRGRQPFYLNIATTRGCPYKCNWCAKPIYGNRYNSRSPTYVVDEIELHLKHHQVEHFWMCDDIFGLKPGWVEAFGEELEARQLKIRYKIQSRADLLLKENTIDNLVKSGLDEVWIGAESGSQKILDDMEKGTTLHQIETASKMLKAKGVKVGFFIQYGYLGETMNDIKKTLHLIKRLMPDRLGISVSYPLPGTGFYNKVMKDADTKHNWVDSSDLDMMFSNTYSPIFYRTLHRYTHLIYHIQKGRNTIWSLLTHPVFPDLSMIKSVAKAVIYLPLCLYKWVAIQYLSRSPITDHEE
ncbi:MAG: radical SAM protein [Marinoscillum sp.]|uniref:B12-binding domain-containing radical SAM protein n=1 Tax=Marinoscillum sp. TaxID=2024838 RepID=UPI003302657C